MNLPDESESTEVIEAAFDTLLGNAELVGEVRGYRPFLGEEVEDAPLARRELVVEGNAYGY